MEASPSVISCCVFGSGKRPDWQVRCTNRESGRNVGVVRQAHHERKNPHSVRPEQRYVRRADNAYDNNGSTRPPKAYAMDQRAGQIKTD